MENRRVVHNGTLHQALEAFTADAAARLGSETAGGAEIPFELVEEPGGRVPLYCYRPLTADFIRGRVGLLAALASYAPAARALAALEGLEGYLHEHGETRVPDEPRHRADAALQIFLGSVFDGRSEFGFDPDRFEAAYGELELSLYQGRCTATVIARTRRPTPSGVTAPNRTCSRS
jgi:hypothetical protein